MNPKQTTFLFFAVASSLLAWIVSFSEFQFVLFFILGILWMFILQKSDSKKESSIFTIVLSEVFGILVGLSVFYIIWYLSETPEVRSTDWMVGLMVGGLVFVFQTVSATFGIIGYNFILTLNNKSVA
mgnify:FL=1|jgi:hypothetical protein